MHLLAHRHALPVRFPDNSLQCFWVGPDAQQSVHWVYQSPYQKQRLRQSPPLPTLKNGADVADVFH